MTVFVPYINGLFTLTENAFNICGYLPKDQFPEINAFSTKWRFRFGLLQIITGIALFSLGFLHDRLFGMSEKQKYLSIAQQAISLGILHVNHGVFNLIRSRIEHKGWGVLTGAYDFYGMKVLHALAPPADLQEHVYERIRMQLNRIHFITLFPLEISLRDGL